MKRWKNEELLFPRVRSIIQDSILEFEDWSKEMIISPTIQKLKSTLEQIRKEEIARLSKMQNRKKLKSWKK